MFGFKHRLPDIPVELLQFLGLNPLGTAAFLRMRLSSHLNDIKVDDIEIQKEGIDDLTDDELRQASRARGMPAPFGEGCTAFMQRQMKEWIELSLDKCAALLCIRLDWFVITACGHQHHLLLRA
jgi:hypothetical protein